MHVPPEKVVVHAMECLHIVNEAHAQSYVVFFALFHDHSDVRDLFPHTSFYYETGLLVTDFSIVMLLNPRTSSLVTAVFLLVASNFSFPAVVGDHWCNQLPILF